MAYTSQQELRGMTRAQIETALRNLCEPFGGLKAVSFTQYKRRDQLCFVELNVADNRVRLSSVLNGTSVGDCLVLRVPNVAPRVTNYQSRSRAPRAA